MSKAPPRLVSALAYGGLLPFLALMAASLLDTARSGVWQQLSLNYGAVILSFVGALHWGFAMSTLAMSERLRLLSFAWSVMPALLAWLALLLDPIAGSALMACGFAFHFVQDWRLARQVALPPWYVPMRLRLTVVAALCLLVTSYGGRV
ncbi:DUF3429 domain-containing protein [Massilia sp. PWRC2]|uniref:DUF3429 domain-containing protein n=1 Tax=Massilia sp. PWRC2 TaxID=2804626 RepID=UPI003CF30061